MSAWNDSRNDWYKCDKKLKGMESWADGQILALRLSCIQP